MLPQQFLPQKIGKVSRRGGGLEWGDTVTQMVLEQLARRTPPSYISCNILSVDKVILPKSDVIHQLPGVEFIFLCQVTLTMINANFDEKLAEYRNNKAYDMSRHVQYLKDELGDSRDKAKCLQTEVVNLQVLKQYVELKAGNLDMGILNIKVEIKVQICPS